MFVIKVVNSKLIFLDVGNYPMMGADLDVWTDQNYGETGVLKR